MFKQIYVKIFSICIFAVLTSNCLGMHVNLQKIAKQFHKKQYSYVLHRQAHNENQNIEVFTEDNHNKPFSEKESDILSEFYTLEDSPEKEPGQSITIFSRLLAYLIPKKSTVEIKSNAINGKQIEINEHCHLKQIYVADQFSSQGGGYASCGYQALKNSIYLIKALQESPTTDNLETIIKDFTLINTLFGPVNKNSVGCWRSIIMQKRALIAFKNYLYHNLGLKGLDTIEENTCIQFPTQECFPIKKNKIRDMFATLLNNYAQDAAKSLTEGSTTQLMIQPDPVIEYIQNNLNVDIIKNIYDYISHEPIDVDNNNYEIIACDDFDQLVALVYNYIQDIKTLEKYIDIKSIQPFELSLDNTKEVFDFYNKDNSNPSQLDGDWLQEEEIYTLKKLETENELHFIEKNRQGLLCNLDYELTIIEDTDDLIGNHGGDINQEIFQEIPLQSQEDINKAKIALEDETIEKYIHAFIIGTASRNQSTKGHWFVLLLYKHDGIHEYIVMDSANNSNRLYDERVRIIISLLENQDVTKKAISSEELKYMENKIINMINNKDIEVLELAEHYKECGGKEDFSERIQQLFQN